MPRLLLLTPAEVTRDPRARRAAQAAIARGVGVAAVSGQISGEEPVPLPNVDVIRVGPRGRTDSTWLLGSSTRREPAALREVRGLVRLLRLVWRTWQLVRGGRAWGRADVVHANDFATLPAGYLLAREHGSRLVYDAHELYAEFEADAPRIATALASRIEGVLARRADAVVTVSDALAAELERRFRLADRPHVVLNAPELVTTAPGARTDGPLRAIYQGAFGPGRTLDDLVAAARRAPSVAFTLRVPRTPREELRRALTRHAVTNVDAAEPVEPDAVVAALAGFDVGILVDRPLTRNAELGVPNKLFEYLMAGLAVVAPRLEGFASVVDGTGVGVTVPPGRPEAVGEELERLARDRATVQAMGERARELAHTRFNAERQANALVRSWSF
jgi:glycogen(starch) synthase